MFDTFLLGICSLAATSAVTLLIMQNKRVNRIDANTATLAANALNMKERVQTVEADLKETDKRVNEHAVQIAELKANL